MKVLGYLLAALLCAASPTYAQKTSAQLNSEITGAFTTNGRGAITGQVLQNTTLDIVNSIMPTAPVGAGNVACFNGTTGLLQDCGPRGVSVTTFGAKCDGVTDDTAALQAWASGIVAGGNYILPNSSCLFKSPLTFTNGIQNVTIAGQGMQSQLLYAGTATTGTIISMGSTAVASCSGATRGWTLQNFRIESNTVMTAGDALSVGHLCDLTLLNVQVGGFLNTNGVVNWWNAIHIVGGNNIHIINFNFSGQGTAELLNGDGTNKIQDVWQSHGQISHSGIGLQLAGGVAGFNIDETDILLSGANVQVDQTQQAQTNTQLFFGPLVDIDATSGSPGVGFNLIDPGAGGVSSIVNFDGTWFASAATTGGNLGYCAYVQSTATGWIVNFKSVTVLNCQGEGIHSTSSSAIINVTSSYFDANVGYGFNQTTSNATATVSSSLCGIHGQSPSCFSSNVNTTTPSGANAGGATGIFKAYGSTSGSAFVQSGATGSLQLGNNQGSQNTTFLDGANGSALIIGNASGTIANQLSLIPNIAGAPPKVAASGSDTNIGLNLVPKGTGKVQIAGGTAPTLTAGCNGAGQAISGNDNHGTVTGQTTASTSCTLTFSAAYNATPDCSVTGLSSPLTGAVTVSTSTLVVNFASTANYKWSYVCLGN